MKINIGNKQIKRNGKMQTSIIEFVFGDYTIFVFQGRNSKFDIFIKYKKERNSTKIRTPQHLHWAVDMILKLQGNKELTRNFLNMVNELWNNAQPLTNNDYVTIKTIVENSIDSVDFADYAPLNSYGEYPIEFVYVLILLLAVQEKTNKSDAYMFGDVIEKLLAKDLDIFSIISTASPRRR